MEEIKHGYKQTDIGLIPEDWNVEPIGNLLVFKNGLNKAKEFFGYGTPIVNYMDVYSKDSLHSIDIQGKVHLSNSEILRYEVRKGDVFFTRTSETPEEVGISCVVIECLPKTVFSGFILRGRPINNKLINEFKAYCFQTKNVRNAILQGCTYTTRALTNGTQLSKILIPIPNETEQTAIATALSDTDALIAALEKKIVKKQQIKLGAMQQLLTGKKRLPGFCRKNKYKATEIGRIPEDWDVKPLNKLANIIDPHPSHRAPTEFANGIPFLGIGDFNENGDIIKNTYRVVSKSILTEHNLRYNLSDGLLGLGRVASIGKVIKFRNNIGEFTISPTMGVLKPTLAKRDYLFQILKSEFATQYFAKIMNGSTRSSVGMIVLRRVLIPIPQNESEQSAIAQILTDMDNEIAQLEKKRDKYVQLKAGMMQVLLTGKVRLVNSNAGRNSKKVSIQKAISKTHNQPFEDAALIAAIVNSFYSDKYNLGRKKVQKLLYLLRRKQEASVVAFKRKAAGPYAHEIRYKGGERIAKNNGYVTEISNMKGSIFSKGKNIEEALEYISKWEMQQDIDWLISQFKFTPVDQLEVLTTVDMAICDLEKEEKLVSLKSIKDLISSDKEWKDKLNKPYFNDISIQNAIMQSQELFS